ncbi:hypothetical protein CLCR_00991 [Cladophialophora carrionii]|uniref:Uncharacterized protein n=1 Tax=Cladophialophora carrionii TaxID=86049 RepID=A0A1C1D1D3_9EURO|nr:hypothetical protein CLCR_00991 [Cladophialophora carrionii]
MPHSARTYCAPPQDPWRGRMALAHTERLQPAIRLETKAKPPSLRLRSRRLDVPASTRSTELNKRRARRSARHFKAIRASANVTIQSPGTKASLTEVVRHWRRVKAKRPQPGANRVRGWELGSQVW